MLSRTYQGSRIDAYDAEGAINVLTERAGRGQRPEFHLGAAAAIDLLAHHDLRDQDEFMAALDALYSEEEFYRVRKER